MSPDQLKSKAYIEGPNDWSKGHKMQINEKKTKMIIMNFTRKYKFATSIRGTLTKLFGFGLSIMEKMAMVKIVTKENGRRRTENSFLRH